MDKKLKYTFCEIDFYASYMVARVNKGEHLDHEKAKIISKTAVDHYKDHPFIYITHRKHSYSVDPSVYEDVSKIKTLKGMAVVAEVPVSKGNAQIERMFLKKPFEIFDDLEEATQWAKSLL